MSERNRAELLVAEAHRLTVLLFGKITFAEQMKGRGEKARLERILRHANRRHSRRVEYLEAISV